MTMRPGVLLGIGLAFLGGMATAIMTGNALVGLRQQARATAEREELVAAAQKAQAELDQDEFLERFNESNRRIALAVEPSVVHVSVEGWQRMESPRDQQIIQRRYGASGSGWVYDNKGHVVSNAHVINKPDNVSRFQVLVHFANGRSLAGTVIGADEATDIAVIQVDPNEAPLAPVRRATGDTLRQGDHVYAFGSPFGFKFSMSQGIISGLSRDPGDSLPRNDTYTNYIQSDAAINPGNSGGPLCDIRGRLIGMNVAIASDGRDAVPTARGVGFAIPLTTIEPIVEQIITHGSVSKGFLGVNMPNNDDANDSALKAREFSGAGVVITGLVVGAPAESAGVQVGDVVTAVNGRDVKTVAQFRTMIATQRPGQQLSVRLWREGRTQEVAITLADLDAAREKQDAAAVMIREFGLVDFSSALAITGLRADSAAGEAGFARGQTILSVGSRRVRNLEDLVWVLVAEGFHEGKPVQVTVVGRNGREQTLTMKQAKSDEPPQPDSK